MKKGILRFLDVIIIIFWCYIILIFLYMDSYAHNLLQLNVGTILNRYKIVQDARVGLASSKEYFEYHGLIKVIKYDDKGNKYDDVYTGTPKRFALALLTNYYRRAVLIMNNPNTIYGKKVKYDSHTNIEDLVPISWPGLDPTKYGWKLIYCKGSDNTRYKYLNLIKPFFYSSLMIMFLTIVLTLAKEFMFENKVFKRISLWILGSYFLILMFEMRSTRYFYEIADSIPWLIYIISVPLLIIILNKYIMKNKMFSKRIACYYLIWTLGIITFIFVRAIKLANMCFWG